MTEHIYRVVPNAVAACLILLCIGLVPVAPCTAAGSDIVFGDINNDGQVNVADAALLLRYIVGLTDLEPDQVGRANVSASYDAAGNPTLDVGDAILVLRQITGLVDRFPAQSAAFFTHFSLGLSGETVQLDPAERTVTLMVSYSEGTMEQKIALFGLPYGASAIAEGVPQVSGVTARDFLEPVLYGIMAPDGSSVDWTVIVNRYGEATGSWSTEGIPPMYITSSFRVTVSGLECATHFELYAENEQGEMIKLGDRSAIDGSVVTATLVLNYPGKLEVRFYDGADSITSVAVARCTGAENATAGDLIFNP